MSSVLNYLISACVLLLFAGSASINAAPTGFVEGHLKIVSPKEVELADGSPPATSAGNYAEYPLIIWSRDEQKEITRITADRNGHYRIGLPVGDYILDVQGRAPGHVRAKPQQFTVVSNQIVRVDMDIDTGVR
jgi:hypothetical protein